MLACITKHQDHKRMSPLGKEPFQTLRFLMSHTHGRVVILARMASLSRQQLKRRFVTCVIKIKRRLWDCAWQVHRVSAPFAFVYLPFLATCSFTDSPLDTWLLSNHSLHIVILSEWMIVIHLRVPNIRLGHLNRIFCVFFGAKVPLNHGIPPRTRCFLLLSWNHGLYMIYELDPNSTNSFPSTPPKNTHRNKSVPPDVACTKQLL